MAYKSTPIQTTQTGMERVSRIIEDIGDLSPTELHMLRYRLNYQLNSQLQAPANADNNAMSSDSKSVGLLSRREIDVLTLVAAGYSRKEIGVSLDITSNTAAKHVSSIYRKLNISSIAEATRIAIENGILTSRAVNSL